MSPTRSSIQRGISSTLAALALLGLGGCASKVGSRSMPDVRMNYTESVARSTEQQMLMNIVRLRHLRVPVFLQVSSITTQFGLTTLVGANATANAVPPGGFVPPAGGGANAGIRIEERPTITYTPLQGEEFVKRLATPLSPEAIGQVIQAGWPWDAVLGCCVQQANGLFAPSNPWREEHTDFQRAGELMRELQADHSLNVRTNEHGHHELVFAVPSTDEGKAKAAKVRELLGLDPNEHRYLFSAFAEDSDPKTLTLHGRSMLATLYYMSQGVEGVSKGRPVLGEDSLLHVQMAKSAPRDAYASVDFEGHAYFIARDDLDSQGMFVLLTYLFSLMATPGGGGPMVTVGAGG